MNKCMVAHELILYVHLVGGMSGSYSSLAALDDDRYIFAWQSRGAVDLTADSWMGDGFTQASPHWLNHNVAIATMDAKNKLAGAEAISTVGAKSGDDQVNWITEDDGIDHQNVRVASAGSEQLAVVTWEQIIDPACEPVPLSCSGTFAGTYAQLVDATGTGSMVDSAINLGTDVTVSGDMVTIGTQVCWPFVQQTWDLSKPTDSGTAVTTMSFACLSTDSNTTTEAQSLVAPSSSAVDDVTTTTAVEPTTAAPDTTVVDSAISVPQGTSTSGHHRPTRYWASRPHSSASSCA